MKGWQLGRLEEQDLDPIGKTPTFDGDYPSLTGATCNGETTAGQARVGDEVAWIERLSRICDAGADVASDVEPLLDRCGQLAH